MSVNSTRTCIESPFQTIVFDVNGHKITLLEEENISYARALVHDRLVNHGEAPWASHLLYTQPGILRDDVPGERVHGITAGLAWSSQAEKVIVGIDRGITEGMRRYGIPNAEKNGQEIEYVRLGGVWAIDQFVDLSPSQLAEMEIVKD